MKTSEEIQAEIDRLDSDLRQATEELDSKISEIYPEYYSPIEEWMDRKIREAISDNAKFVQSRGIQELQEIKNKYKTLKANIPDICQSTFAKQAWWPHRQPRMAEKPKENYFARMFREVVGHLGDLFVSCGIDKRPNGMGLEWKKTNSGSMEYISGIDFTPSKFPVIVNYEEKVKAFRSLQQTREHLNHDLEKAKALEMWDAI